MEDKKKIKEELQLKFARGMKKLLKEKELSIRKFSLEADIDYSHVQRICKGEVNLELSTIIKLAAGFKVHPSRLFDIF